MRRLLCLFLVLSIFSYGPAVFAESAVIKISNTDSSDEVSREEVFRFYSAYYTDKIPDTYKYISLNFTDVEPEDEVYKDLQTLVYLDFINNLEKKVHPGKTVNALSFYKLSSKVFDKQLYVEADLESLKNRNTIVSDFYSVSKAITKVDNLYIPGSNKKEILEKKAVYKDIYTTILQSHFEKDEIDEMKMINSAIEGLVEGVEDKHTVYFPPVKNKSFQDNLNGEYEGIGAYVDMEKPGFVRIVSPIPGSPSERAGLKGGDLISAVDARVIEKDNSLQEVISWIKGPAGSVVVLTILRDGEEFDVDVTRENIIIKDVEYRLLKRDTFYIQLKSFGNKSFSEFQEALTEMSSKKGIKKLIIDLRNNGGGYLGEVTKMLSYFVEKGEQTAIVKYLNLNKPYYSKGYDLLDTESFKLVILQNSGTASASEIMIGTLKDYFPDTTVIGEKSYGKGSVQTLKAYKDGSSLKYTVAKWFTGKSETGIDGVGISPDIELELDMDMFNKGSDNQLDKAIKLK